MRTHIYELIQMIHNRTDLKVVSVSYFADCMQAIMIDESDQQKYHIVIKPTELEKL